MRKLTSKQEGLALASAILAKLAEDEPVRQELLGGGRLRFDRRLPFVCVYRQRRGDDDAGTEQLLAAETSCLIVPAETQAAKHCATLLQAIVEYLANHFGSFLIVEIWADARKSAKAKSGEVNGAVMHPRFEIVVPEHRTARATIESLSKCLSKVRTLHGRAHISITRRDAPCPPGLKPLLNRTELRQMNSFTMGIAIRPVYRGGGRKQVNPHILRTIRRGLNLGLRHAFFTFAHQRTNAQPTHYVLGRQSIVKSVLEVDHQLAAIGRSFDLLLQATPVNAESAWREFRRGRFEKPPVFYYRPLTLDPLLLKRQLYLIPVERIDDPTLSYLFRQKQDELDRQITLLTDVDSPRFLHESMQLYGGVSDRLLSQAKELLDRVPTRSGEEAVRGQLSAAEFARLAEKELAYYRKQCRGFAATVSVREDMYTGMMVSADQLLIGGRTRIPKRRAEGLLQHEVGTHLVTRYNGRQQPFQQLEVGLAGYDGLQEGLAVLAEFLVGGLSRFRTRVLAARVVAARQLVDGASFIDTFRLLDRMFEFSQRTAYTITMRIYRGGGLTKDAVYLRGLVQILKYLRTGGDLEPLYIGKVAAAHLPLIAELRVRGIIKPPALRPRYLDDSKSQERIERLREGMTVLQLLEM